MGLARLEKCLNYTDDHSSITMLSVGSGVGSTMRLRLRTMATVTAYHQVVRLFTDLVVWVIVSGSGRVCCVVVPGPLQKILTY